MGDYMACWHEVYTKNVKMATVWLRRIVALSVFIVVQTTPELVVNVRSKSGAITQQEFESIPDEELVAVSYKLNDYRFVDVLLDFNKKLQIFKSIVLGEIDLAENPYEMTCFAIPMMDNEYISPEVMSKLRQKNPSTIRIPEVDLGNQEIVLDHSVQISQASYINGNVRKLCGEIDIIHISGDDLEFLFDNNSSKVLDHGNAVNNLTDNMSTKKRCNSISESNKPCICRLPLCLSWYPCDVKYCQKEDLDGKPIEPQFRCGIKTCGKCRDFDYLVDEKNHCFWDDRLKS